MVIPIGWYECKVFFVNRPPKNELKNGTWINLDVHAPPHFKERPPEIVYVKIGESVSLSCIAQATPQPTTTWLKDNRPLEESPNLRIFPGASELQIVNIQQSDIGKLFYSFLYSFLNRHLTHQKISYSRKDAYCPNIFPNCIECRSSS